MRHNPCLAVTILCSAVVFAGLEPAISQEESSQEATNGAATAPPSAVTYWHNWTDNDGISHLTLCELRDFTLKSMAPPADPLWLNSQNLGDSKLLTVVKPTDWKGDWHSDTKVLWVATLGGKWFVEAMDDTRIELAAGDIVVVENAQSKRDADGREGHRSGNVGDEVVKLMVVQLDELPTVDQPCRFK